LELEKNPKYAVKFVVLNLLSVKNLVSIGLRRIHLKLVPLIAAIGTVGLAVCLIILLGLSWLFQEVWEKEAFGLDTTVLLWLYQWTNPVLDAVMLKITALGDPEFVVVVVVFSLGWLWWKRRRLEAKGFAIACLGALILNQGLKLCFAKPRPQLWTHLITESSFSFPSGHALGSLVLYGFLAYVLARQFHKSARWIYSVAAIVITAIGISRLYLGVHWPTDIVAGYAVGFLWLMVCITMVKLQTQRGDRRIH
jgi:membrane-associated phospholipid phosphatase